jgi:hypothetical protein
MSRQCMLEVAEKQFVFKTKQLELEIFFEHTVPLVLKEGARRKKREE